jgi:prevent-host-death family protein
MLTMTSLEAQNQFGTLLDTSQREPVMITRRGRPMSMVISPNGSPDAVMLQFMKMMSNLAPLRGAEAANAVRKTLGSTASKFGLTEADTARLIRESAE